jgi:hypothetical protein
MVVTLEYFSSAPQLNVEVNVRLNILVVVSQYYVRKCKVKSVSTTQFNGGSKRN